MLSLCCYRDTGILCWQARSTQLTICCCYYDYYCVVGFSCVCLCLSYLIIFTETLVSFADRRGQHSWRGGKHNFAHAPQAGIGASPPELLSLSSASSDHPHQIGASLPESVLAPYQHCQKHQPRFGASPSASFSSRASSRASAPASASASALWHLTPVISKLANSRKLLEHLFRDQRANVAKRISTLMQIWNSFLGNK